jgi:hypothetical protein
MIQNITQIHGEIICFVLVVELLVIIIFALIVDCSEVLCLPRWMLTELFICSLSWQWWDSLVCSLIILKFFVMFSVICNVQCHLHSCVNPMFCSLSVSIICFLFLISTIMLYVYTETKYSFFLSKKCWFGNSIL